MTGVGADNSSEKTVINAIKNLMICKKIENAPYDYVLKRLQSMMDVPCFVVKKAYCEMHPEFYDELQVELAVALIKNFNKYFDSTADIKKILKSKFGLNKDAVEAAYKKLGGN